MKNIRILHVLQSNFFSGAENVVCQIISMFRTKSEYNMAYCSPEGDIDHVLHEKNIDYYPLRGLSVKELKRVIKEYNPSIIHAHDISASVIATLAAGNIPFVVHVHGNHLNMRRITIKSVLVLLFAKKWKKIVWVSRSAMDDFVFKSEVQEKSILLSNIILKESVIDKVAKAKEVDAYDCIVLGRINSIKNPIRGLTVFKKVKASIPNLKVAYVGDGELKDKCIEFINMNDLCNNVDMLGYLDNPMGVLARSKIFVMTSVYEGTPISALEAMALGLPIVSTPTDGVVDLVLQNQTGVCSDDNDSLSNAIIQLLMNKEWYSQVHNNTLKRFDELMNVPEYIETLEHVYGEAII